MGNLFQLFPHDSFSLLGIILGLPLLGAFVNGVFGKRLGREGVRMMALSMLVGSFLAAVVAFAMLHTYAHHHEGSAAAPRLVWTAWKWLSLSRAQGIGITTLQVSFALDPLSAIMTLVVTGVGSLIHLYAASYMWEDPSFHRFFSYLNLFVFAMLVLLLGDSLPLLFVGWEGVGLCSYLLIGFWFSDDKNASAAKKAFLANRVGDFGLLLGMAMLLYYAGALDYQGIHEGASGLLTKVQVWPLGGGVPVWLTKILPAGVRIWLTTPREVYAATLCGLFLFLGCAGKSAQIPLYVWLPDAMAGPTPVSALIHAATMVTAGIYLVCRLGDVFVLSPAVMATIATTGALTAFLAATIGLVQHDLKKVLAYSTVSQLGYMFLGVGVGAFTDGFFHVFTHAFFKACLFLAAGSVIHAMHASIHDTDGSQDMRNMGGLRAYLPFTHATYLVSCLAIAGVPPLAGFFSKDEILAKAFESTVRGPSMPGVQLWTAPSWFGKVLFVIGIVTAAMTAFYMFRTYFLTFWGNFRGWKIVSHVTHSHHGHDAHDHHDEVPPGQGLLSREGLAPHESPWAMTAPLVVLATFAAGAGFLNAQLLAETFHAHSLAWLDHWLEPVFASSRAAIVVPPFAAGHAWALAVPGLLAAVGGIGFAYFVYVLQGGVPVRRLAEQTPALHRFLLDKWRVDEFYQASVVGTLDELANTAVFIDKWLIDGVIARLSAVVVKGAGMVLRTFQTGRVQAYAAVMVLGTLGLGVFFYLPHPDATVTEDAATGAYHVQAASGVGYRFRWDANGDGKPDAEEFTEKDNVDVRVNPGSEQKVTLEVQNAFRRKASRTFPIVRAKKEEAGPGAKGGPNAAPSPAGSAGSPGNLEELMRRLQQMQGQNKE